MVKISSAKKTVFKGRELWPRTFSLTQQIRPKTWVSSVIQRKD